MVESILVVTTNIFTEVLVVILVSNDKSLFELLSSLKAKLLSVPLLLILSVELLTFTTCSRFHYSLHMIATIEHNLGTTIAILVFLQI